MTRLIPGNPNIHELGFVNPFFFITVEESKGNTPFHPSEQATVGRTNGTAERITYVSFNVPPIGNFPGATADTKCFLLPLPDTIDKSGSKSLQIFSLASGFTLPTSLTFNTRPGPDQQLSTVTYGDSNGITPITMENPVKAACHFGGKQEFLVRCTGDNALFTFTTNPINTQPNGMVLVIGNVSN